MYMFFFKNENIKNDIDASSQSEKGLFQPIVPLCRCRYSRAVDLIYLLEYFKLHLHGYSSDPLLQFWGTSSFLQRRIALWELSRDWDHSLV